MSSENSKFNTQVEDPSKPDAPKHEHGLFEPAKQKFQAHTANPGPAIPTAGFNVAEEGTKEERRKRAEELNKNN